MWREGETKALLGGTRGSMHLDSTGGDEWWKFRSLKETNFGGSMLEDSSVCGSVS